MEIRELVRQKVESLGDDFDSLKPRTVDYLIQIEEFVQNRALKRKEGLSMLSLASFNKTSVAEELNCSRATLYKTNNALLKRYIDHSVEEFEKQNPFKSTDRTKEAVKKLSNELKSMQERDLDFELQRHENEELVKKVKESQREIDRLQRRVHELSQQLHEVKKKIPQPSMGKIIDVNANNKFNNIITKTGSDPDIFGLGISYGNMEGINETLMLADQCNTHTVMTYCNNDLFQTPDVEILGEYDLVLHGPININLASNDDKIRRDSIDRVKAIIKRCNRLYNNISSLVLHPGSASSDVMLIESMREILPLAHFRIALENMSGKGTELMSTFEEIEAVADALSEYKNFSICLDTCHLNDAGYDFSDSEGLVAKILEYVRSDQISVWHINDSKNEIGSRKDRHEKIGNGTIPIEGLSYIVRHEFFNGVPKILETPQSGETISFAEEMQQLIEE